MRKPAPPPTRRRRRRRDGVVRDAFGNRISPEALRASPRAPTEGEPPPKKRPPRAVRERRRVEGPGGLRPAFFIMSIVLLIVGGAYLLIPPSSIAGAKPRVEADTKKALYLGVLKVEAYRKVSGMVPFEIQVANVRAKDGYTYERVDDRHYVLTFREPDGRFMTFDSRTPIERFFGTANEMLGTGDGS